MPRGFTQVAPDSSGDKIAHQTLTDGADTVARQEILISDPTTLAAVAAILGAAPAGTEYALAVRQVGSNPVGATPLVGGIPSNYPVFFSAASNNATVVKASRGRVYGIQGYNNSAGIRYINLYDKATAPAPASDTGVLRKKFAIPAATAFAFDWPLGLDFTSGIAFAFVAGTANNDNTAVASVDIVSFNMDYA
jgi:hypothetical protein